MWCRHSVLCLFGLINVPQREHAFNGFLDFHFFKRAARDFISFKELIYEV